MASVIQYKLQEEILQILFTTKPGIVSVRKEDVETEFIIKLPMI